LDDKADSPHISLNYTIVGLQAQSTIEVVHNTIVSVQNNQNLI